ncbi:outer membrane protein assembly factor BamB [Carnimonas bestiolae]|uniref:outer membrane protein assembly factor BamB n=1 Tax=Carnimonas bestiolae TaxID=3402172 RepID=UPI003EDB8A12
MKLRYPLRTVACALSVSAFLAGCGGGVKPDPAPKPLTSIQQTVALKTLWDRGIGNLGRARNHIEPALDSGVLYAADAEGKLTAIDAETGKVQWEQQLHVPVSTGVSVNNGRLFVGTAKGEVLAVSISDGSVVWRTQVASAVASTPQANSNLVVVQSVDGTLTALDKLSGNQQWLYASQQPSLTLHGNPTPRTIDPVTFAGFANGQIALFDNRSGNMMWNARVGVPEGSNAVQQMNDVVAQPVLTEDGRLYASGYNGNLIAVNVRSGEPLWEHSESSYRTPLLEGGTLYTVDAKSHVHAFDAMSGQSLWENSDLEGRNLTAPAYVNGQLAVGDFEGYVHLLDATSGKLDGRDSLGGDGIGITPLSDGNTFYVLTFSGKLVAYQTGAQ